MLDGIRSVVAGDDAASRDWDVNQPLEPEVEDEYETEETESSQPINHAEPAKATTVKDADYYLGLVRSSIASGGKFGDHRISVYWLQTILDGFEGRDTEHSIWRVPDFQDPYFGA